mmetsp:Transcript_102313/g.328107  ORF Transcript_102313/g.328107 Transcript_102313/m.328107 type:complete len:261 (+) Transcript_102313:3943-4725(+)
MEEGRLPAHTPRSFQDRTGDVFRTAAEVPQGELCALLTSHQSVDKHEPASRCIPQRPCHRHSHVRPIGQLARGVRQEGLVFRGELLGPHLHDVARDASERDAAPAGGDVGLQLILHLGLATSCVEDLLFDWVVEEQDPKLSARDGPGPLVEAAAALPLHATDDQREQPLQRRIFEELGGLLQGPHDLIRPDALAARGVEAAASPDDTSIVQDQRVLEQRENTFGNRVAATQLKVRVHRRFHFSARNGVHLHAAWADWQGR